MNLLEILRKSFLTLIQRPLLFLPKIISTSISSVWIISFLYLPLTKKLLTIYLTSFPFITMLGVYVSILLAKMVEIKDEKQLLSKSIRYTNQKYKQILFTTVGLIFGSLIVTLPLIVGFIASYILTNLIYLIVGTIIAFSLIILMTFSIFFLPISLIEKNSLKSSLKDSINTSLSKSQEVMVLILFSFSLLFSTFLLQGFLQKIGYIGFFLGRLISTIVSTYIFVVSPTYYLEEN